MERVSIFVDGANMYYAQKRLGWFIDYRKLLCYFRTTLGMKVADAYYYTAVDPNAKGRDATFHDYLLHSGMCCARARLRAAAREGQKGDGVRAP